MRNVSLIVLFVAAGCAGKLPSAAAPTDGWIDFTRVKTDSAMGKRMAADDAVFVGSRQQQADKIGQQFAAAEKAKDKDIESKRAVASQTLSQFNAEIKARREQDDAKLVAAVQPIASAVGNERHLARVDFGQHLWATGDLTDEVIRRMNATEATGMAAELAKARAENAALKASALDKTTTKGTSP